MFGKYCCSIHFEFQLGIVYFKRDSLEKDDIFADHTNSFCGMFQSISQDMSIDYLELQIDFGISYSTKIIRTVLIKSSSVANNIVTS